MTRWLPLLLLLLAPLALSRAETQPLKMPPPAQSIWAEAVDHQPAAPEQLSQACCKTCRKGKACGDSCIAREKVCEKPKGCACDAAPVQ